MIGLQEVDVHWGARSDFADEARALAGKLDMRVFFAPSTTWTRPSRAASGGGSASPY
ncbi:hypothetical protein GCM10023238_17450 [Streptomyces heliomycini]